MELTFEEFERRVAAEPDLKLGWQYWNWLLPETAPGYFVWMLLIFFDEWQQWREAKRA